MFVNLRKPINTLQTLASGVLFLLSVKEWRTIFTETNKKVSAALMLTNTFLAAISLLRLRETLQDDDPPTPTSMLVWHAGFVLAILQYGLARGWFLNADENEIKSEAT